MDKILEAAVVFDQVVEAADTECNNLFESLNGVLRELGDDYNDPLTNFQSPSRATVDITGLHNRDALRGRHSTTGACTWRGGDCRAFNGAPSQMSMRDGRSVLNCSDYGNSSPYCGDPLYDSVGTIGAPSKRYPSSLEVQDCEVAYESDPYNIGSTTRRGDCRNLFISRLSLNDVTAAMTARAAAPSFDRQRRRSIPTNGGSTARMMQDTFSLNESTRRLTANNSMSSRKSSGIFSQDSISRDRRTHNATSLVANQSGSIRCLSKRKSIEHTTTATTASPMKVKCLNTKRLPPFQSSPQPSEAISEQCTGGMSAGSSTLSSYRRRRTGIRSRPAVVPRLNLNAALKQNFQKTTADSMHTVNGNVFKDKLAQKLLKADTNYKTGKRQAAARDVRPNGNTSKSLSRGVPSLRLSISRISRPDGRSSTDEYRGVQSRNSFGTDAIKQRSTLEVAPNANVAYAVHKTDLTTHNENVVIGNDTLFKRGWSSIPRIAKYDQSMIYDDTHALRDAVHGTHTNDILGVDEITDCHLASQCNDAISISSSQSSAASDSEYEEGSYAGGCLTHASSRSGSSHTVPSSSASDCSGYRHYRDDPQRFTAVGAQPLANLDTESGSVNEAERYLGSLRSLQEVVDTSIAPSVKRLVMERRKLLGRQSKLEEMLEKADNEMAEKTSELCKLTEALHTEHYNIKYLKEENTQLHATTARVWDVERDERLSAEASLATFRAENTSLQLMIRSARDQLDNLRSVRSPQRNLSVAPVTALALMPPRTPPTTHEGDQDKTRAKSIPTGSTLASTNSEAVECLPLGSNFDDSDYNTNSEDNPYYPLQPGQSGTNSIATMNGRPYCHLDMSVHDRLLNDDLGRDDHSPAEYPRSIEMCPSVEGSKTTRPVLQLLEDPHYCDLNRNTYCYSDYEVRASCGNHTYYERSPQRTHTKSLMEELQELEDPTQTTDLLSVAKVYDTEIQSSVRTVHSKRLLSALLYVSQKGVVSKRTRKRPMCNTKLKKQYRRTLEGRRPHRNPVQDPIIAVVLPQSNDYSKPVTSVQQHHNCEASTLISVPSSTAIAFSYSLNNSGATSPITYRQLRLPTNFTSVGRRIMPSGDLGVWGESSSTGSASGGEHSEATHVYNKHHPSLTVKSTPTATDRCMRANHRSRFVIPGMCSLMKTINRFKEVFFR